MFITFFSAFTYVLFISCPTNLILVSEKRLLVSDMSLLVSDRALVVSVGSLQSQRQHVTRCLSDAKLRLRLYGCDNDINVRQMSIDR